MSKDGDTVFALSSYSIMEREGFWYIAKTSHWDGKHVWSHKYASLTKATNAIARHLQREWTERKERQQRWNKRIRKRAA